MIFLASVQAFGSTLLNVIYFIIALGLLVTVHEFGHYITAKIFNVYVNEFSIGFGPLIFKKKKGETEYSLRMLPLGGYCSMAGEGMEDNEVLKDLPPERFLQGIKKWKRAIIMIAGVTLNLVLAFFLFLGYFTTTAQIDEKATYVIANSVKGEESPLQGSGYQNENIVKVKYEYIIEGLDSSIPTVVELGDITEINSLNAALSGGSYEIDGKYYAYTPLTANDKKIVTFYCEGGNEYNFVVTPFVSVDNGGGDVQYSWNLMGASYPTYRLNFFQAVGASFNEVGESAVLIFKAFGTLFTKEGISSVGGPIAIFQVSSQAASYGFGVFLRLWGMISVNLAVFNLLPFPGLDGWHFLVIIVESITRKEMPTKAKQIASAVGLLLLFVLMFLVTIKDIIGLF